MMSFTQLAAFGTTLLALSNVASSHMTLANPVPYGNPNNSPLDPSGSDFPCKGLPSTGGKVNEFAVGSSQKLSFSGSAVHGGGSCQLSVTTDNPPTKNSVWKVIHSFEGGCPASTAGNFADGTNNAAQFPFTVPEELPNGQLTLAWTWFNKVGNREMYMNCANINVSGGSKDTAAFQSLPDMAVANIASQGTCKTSESSDYTFENPGKYVTRSGTGPFKSLCGGTASNPPPGDGTVPEPPKASSIVQPPAPPATSVVQPPVPQPTVTSPPSQQTEAPQPPAVTSTLRTLVTVTATAPGTPVATQAPPPPSNGGAKCSNEGGVVCNGDSQFGLCNFGQVVWQPVADGTKCSNDAIVKREYIHRARRSTI